MFKRFTKLILLLALLCGFVHRAVAIEQTPYQLMQTYSAKLFNDIKQNHAKIKQNPDYMRAIVREDLIPFVHVKYAASLILGPYFRQVTSEQREQYFTAFAQFIERTYAQVLMFYNGQKIQIGREKSIGQSRKLVRVSILQTNTSPIQLDFKWFKNTKTGQWLAYDMVVNGISMVESKKQEWAPVLRTQGIDVLTQKIKQIVQQPITLK